MRLWKKNQGAGPARPEEPEEAAGLPSADGGEDEDIRGGPAPIDPDQEPWGLDGPPWDGPPDIPVQRTGVGQDAAPAEEEDRPEDLAAGMARPDDGSDDAQQPGGEDGGEDPDPGAGKKGRKAKRERGPRKDRGAATARPNPLEAWSRMEEPRRQVLFTCGCVTAAFCLVVLIICGTVLALRTFRVSPSPALAKPAAPAGQGDIYYDESGKMHVNVHITREPDTQVTVYVLPDGSMSTEKPADTDAGGVKTVVLYVDKDGNVSETPPAPVPAEPEVQWPQTAELYMDKDGRLSETEPDGYWKKVVVLVNEDGSVEIQDGGSHGLDPGSDASSHMMKAELYVGQDGHIHTSDPGGGDRYTVSVGEDGSASIEPGGGDGNGNGDGTGNGQSGDGQPEGGDGSPAGDGTGGAGQDGGKDGDRPGSQTGTEPAGGSYMGKTEAEILAEAERRRQSGKGWYLDSDRVYIIQKGDTLGMLSGRFGFSVDFLAEYNNIKDKNLIITGEALRYPASGN